MQASRSVPPATSALTVPRGHYNSLSGRAEPITEIILDGVIKALGLISETAGISASAAFVLQTVQTWQHRQAERFIKQMQYQLKLLEMKKIDRQFVFSDEFRSLTIQAVRIATETASEVKLRALAAALANSALTMRKNSSSREMLLRILGQLSDEEILILGVFYQYEQGGQRGTNSPPFLTMNEIAQRAQWSRQDTEAAVLGLMSLGLIQDPIGLDLEIEPLLPPVHDRFALTVLGDRLIRWIMPS